MTFHRTHIPRLHGRRKLPGRLFPSLLLIAFGIPCPSGASPSRIVDLRWKAPPGCPREEDVLKRIQKILGAGHWSAPITSEGTIQPVDRKYRLDLVVRYGDVVGTRTIDSHSCDDLAGAAAVEIGLLVNAAATVASPVENPTAGGVAGGDRSDTSQNTETAPTPTTKPDEKNAPAPKQGETKKTTEVPDPRQPPSEPTPQQTPPGTEPQPAEHRTRTWELLVHAPFVASAFGYVPSPTLGTGLGLGFAQAEWSFSVQGVGWRGQRITHDDFPGYGADVDRIGASASVCRNQWTYGFILAPCVVAGAARVTARGYGPHVSPTSRHATMVHAGVGMQGRLPLWGPLRLLATSRGDIEFVRPEISIRGLGLLAPQTNPPDPPTTLSRTWPVTFTFTLGFEWGL